MGEIPPLTHTKAFSAIGFRGSIFPLAELHQWLGCLHGGGDVDPPAPSSLAWFLPKPVRESKQGWSWQRKITYKSNSKIFLTKQYEFQAKSINICPDLHIIQAFLMLKHLMRPWGQSRTPVKSFHPCLGLPGFLGGDNWRDKPNVIVRRKGKIKLTKWCLSLLATQFDNSRMVFQTLCYNFFSGHDAKRTFSSLLSRPFSLTLFVSNIFSYAC